MAAVEFALLALPFFALLAAILQTSLVFIASQVLDSALIDASRYIRIGEAQRMTSDEFKRTMCDHLYGLFGDCSGMHLRVNTIVNFTTATATLPLDLSCNQSCEWNKLEAWQPGDASSKVMVQVYFKYSLPIPLGVLGMSNVADGSRLIGATYVFMNEPF